MTLVSSIINDAFRETNINALGQAPTDDQNTEGLRRLQTLVSSMLGNEAGDPLTPFPLGQNEINSPNGYPWYANELPGNVFVPVNSRIMLNLTGPGTINLHPKPHDGARMGIVDVSQNLNSFPLHIYGNGRSIEGDDVQTYDESGTIREWFYREDLGDWKKVTSLALTDDMPFPAEFDDLFIILLAARLNPRHGQTLDAQSVEALKRARTQFRARYSQDTQMPSEDGLLYLTNYYRQFGRYANRLWGDSADYFDVGYPF